MKLERFWPNMEISSDDDNVSISFSINSITIFFAICGKFSFTNVRILVSLEILLNDTMFLNQYEIYVLIITVAQLSMEGRVCFLFQKLSLINHTTLYRNQRNNFTMYTFHWEIFCVVRIKFCAVPSSIQLSIISLSTFSNFFFSKSTNFKIDVFRAKEKEKMDSIQFKCFELSIP